MKHPNDLTRDSIRLAAVGDILLAAPPHGVIERRSPGLVSDDVRRLFSECDLVFGNLECTLPGDGRRIPTEPRVVARPDRVRAVKAAGFTVLTLANNHMFDCFEQGFGEVVHVLEELDLPHFGAGMSLGSAVQPALFEANGIRLAFLAAVDERTGPFQFADAGRWGVAPLDMQALTERVANLRSLVDHVVVSVHWGDERFLIPGPIQLGQAQLLVEAGASLVLGHHPHVVQGLDCSGKAPIIYSLGNFLADDVYFTSGDVIHWRGDERYGCVLIVDLAKDGARVHRQVPTYDSGAIVDLDRSGIGSRRIARANKAIAKGVTLSAYRREHFRVKTVLPSIQKLHWSRWGKLRPRHFVKGLSSIYRNLRAN